MDAALREAVGQAVGGTVHDARGVSGGDINAAWLARLSDGRAIFVKSNRGDLPEMFPAEARGLAWLAEPAALRVPEVLGVGVSSAGEHFLALQYVPPGAATRSTSVQTGRGLALIHRAGPADHGLEHGNFIGRLPQDNLPMEGGWADFWWQRRLEPQISMATRHLDVGLRRDFERLRVVLPDRVGPSEPPARLHGDLWGGNLHIGADGTPWLIDPAAYGGHREADLAMMQLFGGFDARCFAAYDEVWPRAPGHAGRVPLYQLYYLLVHVNLFGAGWMAQVRGALRQVL